LYIGPPARWPDQEQEMSKQRFLRIHGVTFVAALAWTLASGSAAAEDEHAHHGHQEHGDAHAQHQAMMNQRGYVKKLETYQLPAVTLTDQDGNKVALGSVLDGPKPVMLTFIFTTCTTICPVLTASFSQAQKTMEPEEREAIRLVSISIDPEHDTPEKLRECAARFHAQPGWEFLTGDLSDIVAVLKAFDAYRGDKMNHIPLTLLRAAPGEPWVRLEGFASSAELLDEYRELVKPERAGAS
jgi:protein SCO1/2